MGPQDTASASKRLQDLSLSAGGVLSPRPSTTPPSPSFPAVSALSASSGHSTEKPYAVIGIDFGTTYSGVSWTWSGNINNTDQISSWDTNGRDHNSDKVPSRVIYDARGELVGWGFNRKPDGNYHLVQWFKLLLSDEASELGGEKVKEAKAQLLELRKDAIDVVSDYLRQLWLHAIKIIELRLTKIVFDNMDVRVVLTIPANWDLTAQRRTKEAAVKAGITARRDAGLPTFKLVTEPEAAALATWQEAGLEWHPNYKPGDCFTVCDAGGGTVDLISYRVESIKPLRLAMCVIPTGGLCGAVYLDQAFENHIRTIVGRSEYDKISKKVKAKVFDSDWEHSAKRSYTGGTDPWPFDIPGYKPKKQGRFSRKPESSTIYLEPSTLNTIFQPICNRVVDLVRTQVTEVMEETSANPKAILLVGGFGENEYLMRQLRATFSKIPIQRPTRAWSAISRGAVAKGLSNDVEDEVVTNVISKYSYGIAYNEKFDPTTHLPEDQYFCSLELIDKAANQVMWYLRRGDDVKKVKPVQHSWKRFIKTRRDLINRAGDEILICDLDTPPTRRTDKVKKLCRIESSFDEDVFDTLTVRSNSEGINYRVLMYSLNMKVSAEDLEWMVYFRDEERGGALSRVEYH